METVYIGNGEFADVNALYSAALLAPNVIKLGSQDTWGNVKIPSLNALNSTLTDSNGWVPVPTPISSAEDYTSLVGLPVVGRSLGANANFNIESSYLSVQCSNFTQTMFPNDQNNLFNTPDFDRLSDIISGRIWSNLSTRSSPFNNPFNKTTFFLDTDLPLFDGSVAGTPEEWLATTRFDGFVGFTNQSNMGNPISTSQRKLIFGSAFVRDAESMDFAINRVECSLSQTHVESVVECVKDHCAVTKVRKSLTDKRLSTWTGLDHSLIANQLATNFPTSFSRGRGSTPTERFLSNTTEFPFVQAAGNLGFELGYEDLSSIPSEVFSRRLSLLLNTYYQLSVGPTGYFGSLPQNLSLYGPNTLPVLDVDAYLPKNLSATDHTFVEWWPTLQAAVDGAAGRMPFIGATTNATITTHEQVYICNFAWMSLLLAASTVILVTGAAALLLRRKTMAPEMFGFVASMTYENANVKIPKGGNVLDAMERARILKNMRVCIGDVNGDSEVGHIAFCAGTKFRPLERGRLYE
jgi:hypothetical protein